MDTPDRDQIGTPISKFEDSPVFNYINSLSPIKPLKSINIASTFNPLNFTSPPSVFSSPHVSSHKEFRFLRGHHQFSELSKPEFLSPNGKECGTSMGVLDALQISDCSADPRESSNPTTSTRKVSVDPTSKHSKIGVELPQTLRCDSGSPENNLVPCHDLNTDHVSEVAVTPLSLIHFVQHTSEERSHLFGSEVNLQGVCHIDQNKEEGKGCEWENLISDAAELLNFDSTSDAELSKGQAQKSVDCGTNSFISVVLELPQDNTADLQKAQLVGQNGSYEQHDLENIATQPGDIGQLGETEQSPVIISHTFPNSKAGCNPGDILDDSGEHHIQFGFKAESQQQRGMLRRCLVFEMVGAHKKNLENDSSSSSSISCQSDGNIASEDKSLVPYKPGAGPSPCMLPGIGLHLNALATTSKDCRVVKHEILASGRQLISMPSSISSFRCPTSVQKPLTNSSALNSVERDDDPDDNAVKITEEASHLSSLEINEDLNQSSPKKKRRKLEHAGESESCRRCNCKKSKCLKLYCECFAAGVYCVEPCSCQDCFNKPVHEGTVLATRKQIESRNPLAFAPKVIRSSDSVIEIGDNSTKTPASARHKRGCNCKKSSCLKKYCECFQGGVGCSMNCRCEGCKNTFGRKDGSAPTGTEDVEPEDGETENCEKSTVDKNMQSNEEPKNEEQYPDSILPITPSFQIFRPYVQLPFSSSSKPPRSFLPVGSSKNIHASQRFRKPDFSCPQSKSEKHFKTIAEDETPEILRSNCSPNVVKSTSPNSKRVSPPHSEFGLSPGRRSGRKLILQSIPSFPSLSSHDESNDCPGK